MNRESTGELKRKELLEAFWEFGVKDVAETEMDAVLACVDIDQGGSIGFDEFLMTSIDPYEILTKDNINKAFRDFDDDDGGSISVGEIKVALSTRFEIKQDIWDNVFV